MSFIEWMFLTYLLSITAADIVRRDTNAIYLRAGLSLAIMIIYGVYSLFK